MSIDVKEQIQKFTLMQSLFLRAYTAFGANTEGSPLLSARAAGCKGKDGCASATASRWLKNAKIKKAIGNIKAHNQAVLAEKTGFTMEKAEIEYEEARQLAARTRQPAAMVSATTGKARLYGMDKDAGVGERTVIIISPKAPKVVESVVCEPQGANRGEDEAKGQDNG